MAETRIVVGPAPFRVGDEYPWLAERDEDGAVVTFTGDEIVFVGVTSAHRSSAFDAGQFIMDYLKTRAPFWKREATPEGERWVDARDSDKLAAKRW